MFDSINSEVGTRLFVTNSASNLAAPAARSIIVLTQLYPYLLNTIRSVSLASIAAQWTKEERRALVIVLPCYGALEIVGVIIIIIVIIIIQAYT